MNQDFDNSFLSPGVNSWAKLVSSLRAYALGSGKILKTFNKIKRNKKIFQIRQSTYNLVQKLLRQLSHCPPPPPPRHRQYWTNDTKIYCQVKFFSTLYRGGGEVIMEIERNMKSLIIFARDCRCSDGSEIALTFVVRARQLDYVAQ